jgi:hypothetical protein
MVDLNASLERYVERVRADRAEFQHEIDAVEFIPELLEDDDATPSEDPIYSQFSSLPEPFYDMCGFSVADFDILYDMAEERIRSFGRGRHRILGSRDSFFLLLHWLRTGTAIHTIAAVFGLKCSTLSTRLGQVANRLYPLFGIEAIKQAAAEPFSASEVFSTCGLVVDATVQERDKPMVGFEQAKTYFSGKHHMYGLKSQVVTRRDGTAVHVMSGVPGARHDMKLFRDTVESLEALIAAHPGEPVEFLADMGYMGDTGSQKIVLHTPVRTPAHGVLSIEEARHNKRLSKERIVVEHFFGRLQNKFHVLVKRWHLSDAYYGTIFKICCGFANFDIRVHGGRALHADDGIFYQHRVLLAIQESQRRFQRAQTQAARRLLLRDLHLLVHREADVPEQAPVEEGSV